MTPEFNEHGPNDPIVRDCDCHRFRALYDVVNEMMAPLGYHGTISARDDRVQAVMDALHAIDGG